MACCKKKRLKELLEACVEDKLFDKDLRTSIFKCVVEIIRNSKKKKFDHCFSEKTQKKILKHKKFLKKLVDSTVGLKKRKKKFISSSKAEKKLFYNYILHDFIHNCIEED